MQFSKRRFILIPSFILILLSVSFFIIDQLKQDVFDVYYQEQFLGTVDQPEVIEAWADEKRQQWEALHPNVTTVLDMNQVSWKKRSAIWPEIQTDDVINQLERVVLPETYGVEIQVAGKTIGIVKDEKTASSLLEVVKRMYTPNPQEVKVASSSEETIDDVAEGKSSIESVDFVQEVNVVTKEIKPEEAGSRDQVLDRLLEGNKTANVYTVQAGDCISCIADRFDVPVDTIYKNNPWIVDDFITIGDKIDLSATQPILSVRTIETRTDVLDIPFGTKYIEDSAKKKGNSEIKIPGKNGTKQVAYRIEKINGEILKEELVQSTVVTNPVTQVVIVGTKLPPGTGTGEFTWPVSKAEVTSEYGKRWGRFHAGTDAVSENRKIYASDSGEVILAGWNGGYGNCVIIDHKNGYQTLYAHMSSLKVKEGQKVEKGQQIGVMGTTGRSTGVHLHFEIRKDGKQKNPLNYL